MQTSISLLADMLPLLAEKNIENIFFKKHLRQYASAEVDNAIHQLARQVTPQINCQLCGNCCKKLEPGLETEEIPRLAKLRGQTPESFRQQCVAFDGDAQFLKTKPCLFLHNNSCSIYLDRPKACAGFPHLDTNNLKYKRSLWDNYMICPIVFNVLEALKQHLHFSYAK
jgi:uncharacterized protein